MLRAVHSAAITVMEENGVDVSKFNNRSGILSNMVQDASPSEADVY